MKMARVIGRVFCTRAYQNLEGKTLLLIQPQDWETEENDGDALVAADTVGAGAGEKVFWVASREAAVAFKDVPLVDAAVVGIIEGHQVRDFRGKA